jgi:hypothetical protein
MGIPWGIRSAGLGPGVGVGGNLFDSGNRSGAEGGGVGTGTLFGLGIRSRGICGVGVGEGVLKGEGALNGEGDDDADGDGLGCAFCARRVTPMKQKTITKSVRTMITFDTLARVRGKKSRKEEPLM